MPLAVALEFCTLVTDLGKEGITNFFAHHECSTLAGHDYRIPLFEAAGQGCQGAYVDALDVAFDGGLAAGSRLTGRKLAWCNVGDASIQLFRPAPGEGRLRCVFSTVE